MNSKQSKYFQNWPKDFLAGFVVSLVALPLGLSLAVASGVPPISGIIACVVGGLIVSIFGGSNVTIVGAGNGLVVIVLSAVVVLGEGDLMAGYLAALAAIFISGILITLLGFFRMGNLADFFPSATIQGLLSAIGFILIAKQSHVMLGENGVEAANNLFLLVKIPQSFYALTIIERIPFEAIIGILSLLVMWAYPKIPIRKLRIIPAPMWIVLIAISFYLYFEYFSSHDFPIPAYHMIQLPENFIESIVFPDFSKIGEWPFIKAVIGITLIASIESILSIKAVDKLDPLKRKSDINKDLKALGFSTSISSLIGGLPVVAVIARSSVNVNQGAVSRTSNFFHALFVAFMVLLFASYLNMIPLASLAGILVYTGYRLASPSVFRRMWNSGRDQFLIFLITILCTLLFGLLNGLILGVIATFISQLILMKGSLDFLLHPKSTNAELFHEEDGKYYLVMGGHLTFLNLQSLRKELKAIPKGSHVILDLSKSLFVGHLVMESIDEYKQEFLAQDGLLEVVGLDIHDATAAHPFAARRVLKIKKFMQEQGILTSRQELLKAFAKDVGWKFRTNSVTDVPELEDFDLFKRKKLHHAYNVFEGKYQRMPLKVMDVGYISGDLSVQERHRQTIMIFELADEVPCFKLYEESFLERVSQIRDENEVLMEGHLDFTKRFRLLSDENEATKKLLTDKLILFLESNPFYHLECTGKHLLITRGKRLASISEVKALARFGKGLLKRLLAAQKKQAAQE